MALNISSPLTCMLNSANGFDDCLSLYILDFVLVQSLCVNLIKFSILVYYNIRMLAFPSTHPKKHQLQPNTCILFFNIYVCNNITNRFCNVQSDKFKRLIVGEGSWVCIIDILYIYIYLCEYFLCKIAVN